MSLLSVLPSTSRAHAARALPSACLALSTPSHPSTQTRNVSSSPYGRTHVWKRRPKTLPNPMVPVFAQRLVRVDGSTIVHHTTSPRSVLRLTRDTTNNPVWNAARFVGMDEEEDEVTGRLGRFSRRFADLGAGNGKEGAKDGKEGGMEWIHEASGEEEAKHVQMKESGKKGKSK